jgi:hypothetical protein
MNYQESQGVMCKSTFSFLWTSSRAGTGAPRRLQTAGSAGDQGGEGWGEAGENREKSKGISMEALPWTEKGGEIASGDIHGGRLGLQGAAALRRWGGDGEGLKRGNASTWISWRPRLGPTDDGGGESAAVAHRPATAATPWPAEARDKVARRSRVRARVARGAPLLWGAGP